MLATFSLDLKRTEATKGDTGKEAPLSFDRNGWNRVKDALIFTSGAISLGLLISTLIGTGAGFIEFTSLISKGQHFFSPEALEKIKIIADPGVRVFTACFNMPQEVLSNHPFISGFAGVLMSIGVYGVPIHLAIKRFRKIRDNRRDREKLVH